jgi:hypothetical protein
MRLTFGVVAALTSVLGVAAQVQSPSSASVGRINGRVATAYAELVADATVTLIPIDRDGYALGEQSVSSDPKGGFTFERLPPGRYHLSATKKGYTSRQPMLDAGASEPRAIGRFDTGPVVELAGSDAVNAEVVLYRSTSIAGRIIGPDGSAAPDVQVMAASGHGTTRVMLFETQTWSAWDGRYEIGGLPPGEYLIGAMTGLKRPESPQSPGSEAARARGAAAVAVEFQPTGRPQPATWTWTWYPGVKDSEPGEAVALLEGVAAEGIDIWLTPAQRFNVSGRVFWPVGVNVEGITIDYGDPSGARSGVWIVSDPGGLFTLAGHPPGPLVLLARAETDQGSLIGIVSTEVTVDAVEDVQIVVDRPGTVEGRVTYEDNIAPAAHASTIALTQTLFKVSALYPVSESAVDASGRFQLRDALGEYEFELRDLPPGYAITRVLRDGVPLRANRISVMGGEAIRGIELVVGKR